jgi:hypothetical protein
VTLSAVLQSKAEGAKNSPDELKGGVEVGPKEILLGRRFKNAKLYK